MKVIKGDAGNSWILFQMCILGTKKGGGAVSWKRNTDPVTAIGFQRWNSGWESSFLRPQGSAREGTEEVTVYVGKKIKFLEYTLFLKIYLLGGGK